MAVKIITCPWCGKEARITYEENRVYQIKCYSCHSTMLHVDHSFDSAVEFFEHQANLLQAEKDGRLVVIPWAAGDVIYEADPAHGVVKHTFSGEPAWMMHSYAVDDAGNEWYDGWGSSDETPFYKTREEAEAALALKGGEG